MRNLFGTPSRDKIVAVCSVALFALALTGIFGHGLSGQAPPQPLRVPATVNYTTVTLTNSTANNQILPAAGTGLRYVFVAAQCSNTSTTATEMILQNGTKPAWTLPCPISAGSSQGQPFVVPIAMSLTNTAVNVNLSVAVTSGYVNLAYYTSR